jgi:hypothetical protein
MIMSFAERGQETADEGMRLARDADARDADLARLSHSPETAVRAAVGEQAKTPLTCLLRLAEDPEASVRAAVARNPRPDLPEEVRKDLAHDKAVEVQLDLIRNPHVPDRVIARLARSRHHEVAVAVQERLGAKGTKARVLGMLGYSTD